jgi:23S rRNA-/tRNA-specific pseudouridylate synthase
MEILFIDPLFLMINKPSGLLSVPGKGEAMQDSVVNQIKSLFSDCINQHQPCIASTWNLRADGWARTKEAHSESFHPV